MPGTAAPARAASAVADVGALADLVVYGSRENRRGRWTSTFKAHRATCRYADRADPIAAYLDLWGRTGLARMVAAGTVTTCTVCKPDVDPRGLTA